MIFLSYADLHRAAEEHVLKKLKKRGHKAELEFHANDSIFDVYDKTTDTVYEILTAKIVVSAHEQPEAIITKIFKYLLHCRDLVFYLASYDHEEIDLFHSLGMAHWHLIYDWDNQLQRSFFHKGKKPKTIAKKIYRLLVSFAPLTEWIREGRRKKHPVPKEFGRLTKRVGLPQHFLQGLWRDWRLNWVWKLEKILPKWRKHYGR